jgi:hypothetical protein
VESIERWRAESEKFRKFVVNQLESSVPVDLFSKEAILIAFENSVSEFEILFLRDSLNFFISTFPILTTKEQQR